MKNNTLSKKTEINETIKTCENLQEIIKKIESDGEKQLDELKKQGNIHQDSLINLMKSGENEFVNSVYDFFSEIFLDPENPNSFKK
jgi:hypothetical protein